MMIRFEDFQVSVFTFHGKGKLAVWIAAIFDGYLPCVIVSREDEEDAIRSAVEQYRNRYLPAVKKLRERRDGKQGK